MIVTFPVYHRLYFCYINLFLTYRFLIAAKTVSKYFGSHQKTLTQINKIIDNREFYIRGQIHSDTLDVHS